ncbi:MAG: CCE_0567 family metalloprotein [Thermostichus sp. HHBFW_bins_43]
MSSQPQTLSASELKTRIKRLTSQAGQLKMDLHDLAEGLPTDYELLPELATRTYNLFVELETLKQHLKHLEANP